MRVVMFYHSLASDWNHGNAHFLRGVVRELLERGHDVRVMEPRDGWSRTSLLNDHGPAALDAFTRAYPDLTAELYDADGLDLSAVLSRADLVLVHEWNPPPLVAAIGRHHALHGSYQLLFHDTHHRSVTTPSEMAAYDLRHYDGVLAFGDSVRDRYLESGWSSRAWTWHEAADLTTFYPHRATHDESSGDLVWIGNWGDDERTAELDAFLLEPVRALGLRAAVYGVRYPEHAQRRLAECGISYRGWAANADVPAIFARFTMTVHIPRRPYLDLLPGVPTIRVFEALACGMPLVSAGWDQTAGLFTAGEDFLVAHNTAEMIECLGRLRSDAELRRRLAARGRATICARHSCSHRVDELLAISDRIAASLARRRCAEERVS